MKKRISLLLTFCLSAFVLSAQNLVPNGSFEEFDSCPTFQNQVSKVVGWSSYRQSPDYYNACDTAMTFQGVPYTGVPSNSLGSQQAFDGNAYCGVFTRSAPINYREYLGRQLATPLSIGERYFASIKVSLAEQSNCATDRIGVSFSTAPFTDSQPYPITDHAFVFSNSIILDSVNWVVVSGSFIADSAYRYIVLGNFYTDALTSLATSSSNPCNAYYFIDDICVSTDSLSCTTFVGVHKPRQKVEVGSFPNPFSNQLTFSLADNVATTVSLYNFLGQQVFEHTFTNSTTVNTEHLPAGIYFYDIRNSKDSLKTGKVAKQ